MAKRLSKAFLGLILVAPAVLFLGGWLVFAIFKGVSKWVAKGGDCFDIIDKETDIPLDFFGL